MQTATATMRVNTLATAGSTSRIARAPLNPVFISRYQPRSQRASKLITRAGPPPPPPEAVWEPTGVPMVDELAKFTTLQDAGLHSIKLIAAAAVAVYVGSWLIDTFFSKIDGETSQGFHPIRALVSSAAKPLSSLLPLYGWIYSATVASSLLQVAAGKAKAQFNDLCLGNGDAVLGVIKSTTQLIQDTSEILVIVGLAWTLIGIKDRTVSFIIRTAFKGRESLGRLFNTFSSLLDYGIYTAAGFAALATCGINITPLLASVGGAGVVIGLAAQSILGNIASALTLYASPPFAAGDNIKFLSGGAAVIEGTVLAIEPLRTVLKTTEGSILYIQNSKVVGWEVQNDSQKSYY